MPFRGPDIISRYEALVSRDQVARNKWELLAPHVAPSRVGITSKKTEGAKQNSGVYDGTLMGAADTLARFLAGEITNPASKWLGLKEKRKELNERDDVKEWLEESRDRLLDAKNASNFYSEGFELFVDWAGFGQASMFIGEATASVNQIAGGFRGLRYEQNRIGRYVIAQNHNRIVDTHMQEFELSASGALERFGRDVVSDEIRDAAANPQTMDKLFSFIQSVEPRPVSEQRPGNKGMPWASIYVERGSKRVVQESGFPEYPFVNPRWTVTPGETNGRGPGELALPDTQTLNLSKQMGLEDHALKLRPPIIVANDSVMGGVIRLRPAAVTTVRTKGRRIGDLISPFQTGSQPEVSQIKEEELRRSIREIYMVEQILAMLRVDKPQMTAFEFGKKMELLFRILAPVYGRLQNEYLAPMVERDFNIMLRQGALSDPPDILLEMGGDIQVVFDNPLARAQRLHEVEAVRSSIADVAPIAEIQMATMGEAPIWDKLNTDKAAALIFEVRGVPASVVNSDEEVEVIRAARAEAKQQAEAAEAALKVTEGVRNVAPAMNALQGGAPTP